VPFTATPDAWTARDDAPRLAAGGTVTYTVERRESAGAAWELFAQQTVNLAGPPRPALLLDPSPNPFNPVVRVQFVLARPQRVRLTVYDLAGRRVATLADGAFGAGRQETVWRGVDGRGEPAASGLYMLRLEGERGSDLKRMTLVR
jgi:hypothetical protein